MGIEKPSYLDIGAHHPFNISNTALLYQRGSRGVNIEANPLLMEAFCRHRNEDVNVNCGISPKAGELDFYMFSDGSGLNTFDPVERDQTVASGQPVQKVTAIDTITIDEAVHLYCKDKWPNLLTIDVEGLDYDILKGANFRFSRPEIVCVETRRHASQKMRAMMNEHNYWLSARLAENMIFVHGDQYQKCY